MNNMIDKPKIIFAASGSSGSGYALRMLYHLSFLQGETHWIASPYFFRVLQQEYNIDTDNIEQKKLFIFARDFFQAENEKKKNDFSQNSTNLNENETLNKLFVYDHQDAGARPASGSVPFDGMVVLPCSMKTLAGIANGYGQNLTERAADVCLKERRPLVLVPREAPYNLIHLENMKRLTQAGAIILPASPGFFHHPQTIEDLFDFIVDRVFLQLKINKRVIKEYTT